ncbi:prenyltransferase [Nocardioides jishulii]|uniref:Prenyltransferase n=1 Tax=Nocardioides jishulii TaxID=2575440 RepID=A0A4U2YN16_9ACTN|nr:prenyltransferase [Nocardioides jishulii]QCX27879.1 prenyltransferase [Nocardioides jishulii]TKI62686.1 prenyltransferase [Nocardioides jishulii]
MSAVVDLSLGAPVEPRGLSRLRTVVASSRPLSWVNTAFPFGAAYLLVGGGLDAAFWVGAIFFLVPYNLLMYGVNDVFDHESDVRNPRKGGVEGVVLDRAVHRTTLWAAVLTPLPFVAALLVMGSVSSALVLAVSLFAVVAYSAPRLRFKERPFLDSVTSSTHFVSPAVFGLALAAGRGAEVAWDGAVVATLVGFFLWGMGSHAFGAVQDVRADREGGIASVGTVLGARATVWFALCCYLAAGTALLMMPGPGKVAAALVLPYVVNVAPYLGLTDEECERANAGWRRFLWLNFVTGFLVTQLMLFTVLF